MFKEEIECVIDNATDETKCMTMENGNKIWLPLDHVIIDMDIDSAIVHSLCPKECNEKNEVSEGMHTLPEEIRENFCKAHIDDAHIHFTRHTDGRHSDCAIKNGHPQNSASNEV